MKPVNLIPPEDRRGDRAPLRAGSLSYVVVGALAAALIAVTAYVMAGNSVTDKQNQLGELEAREATLTAEAQALAPYAEFASLQQVRETTVSSLADSRFDWERVLRELAIVNPEDVWLTELTGTAGGGEGADASGLTEGSAVPSLSLIGCGVDHEAVARFVAALEDIDGVTRVGLSNSVRGSGGDSAADAEGGCAGRNLPASFEITAVFDGFAAAAATPPDAVAPQQTNSLEEQTAEAKKAAEIVPGVGQ